MRLDDRAIAVNPYTGEPIPPSKGKPIALATIDAMIRRAFSDEGAKYSPSQPRVPAGSPGGGRWTSGGGGGASASQVASAMQTRAEELEPAATRAVTGAVAAAGGEMAGLEHRLKSRESLERKIRKEAEALGVPASQVEIKDALRYTALLPEESYAQGAKDVHRALAKEGWHQYDHQFKNYWEPGDAYDGYNCVLVNERGDKMEMQFHTPSSITVKEKSHKLYELARTLPDGPERRGLIQGMRDLWKSVERPVGWRELPGVLRASGGT